MAAGLWRLQLGAWGQGLRESLRSKADSKGAFRPLPGEPRVEVSRPAGCSKVLLLCFPRVAFAGLRMDSSKG